MNTTTRILLVLTAAGTLGACGDDITQVTGSALVRSTAEPAGDNCPYGGTALATGIDRNEDGTLGDDEVGSTTFVCDAGGTLVATAPEPAGDNCPDGGISISSGSDLDGDGVLGEDEIDGVTYACATSPGGNALSALADEPPGDNCPDGGLRVDTGNDADGDGVLDAEEIDATSFSCFPAGTGAAILRDEVFADGANEDCETGYVATHVGLDIDGDDTLGEEERSFTSYRCNARPSFTSETTLDVETCLEDFIFDPGAIDIDGTVDSVEVASISAGPATTLVDNGDGTLTLPSGAHSGGARMTITATDNFGATASQSFILRFTGDDCGPLDTFYGVLPDTCVEIDVDELAGDDRGSVVITADYAFYNGDDALIRISRDLETVEVVNETYVDTLFSDAHTLALYSLWDSGITATGIDDTELGYALNGDGNSFDQIVSVDPETYEVSGPVTLELSIPSDEYTELTLDEIDYEFYVYRTLIGTVNGKLVVGLEGEDDLTGDVLIVFLVFDMTTGDLLSHLVLSDADEDLMGYYWEDQEASIVTTPVTERDGEPFIVFRNERDSDIPFLIGALEPGQFYPKWYEVGVTSGTLTLLSETYAGTCDSDTVAVDFGAGLAFGHAEGGCFAEHISESVFRCDVQIAPNDGSIDDTGIWEAEYFGPL